MELNFDALVVGAGYAGAVCARELAERGGKRVLVLERRDHIGGNAYDRLDEAGVLIHQYGPHIFHTNDEAVFRYLCRFTRWRDYQHRVVADLPAPDGGRMQMPVPFNLTSLRKAFGPEEGKRLGEKLIAAYGAEKKVTILELRQNQDPELAKVADYVYEHVFVHYTMKQWGQTPDQIDPNTTARVPVFLSEDDRYFQDEYQGMPLKGYTPLFEAMLDHPNITVRLGEDAIPRLGLDGDVLTVDGVPFQGPVVYTGAADELFGRRFGPLPYPGPDLVPEPGRSELHRGPALHPYHRIQAHDGPGAGGQDHYREGVLPGLHRRAGGDALLRHHQWGEQRTVCPIPGAGRAVPQPAPAGPPGGI